MCYSAQIRADYKSYVKHYGSTISLVDFVDIFWWRWQPEEAKRKGSKVKIPKAMEAAFMRPDPTNAQEVEIKRLIDGFNAEQVVELEQELFAQRKRLADAERTLQTKASSNNNLDTWIAGHIIWGWI